LRNLSLDVVKVGLAILVIVNHSAFIKDYSLAWNYFFTQSVFRFSVPTFFVIGGYFLYRYLSAGRPFSGWFYRLLLIHSVWSIIYLYFYVPHDTSPSEILIEVIKRYIEGYWHLWFTMGMLGGGLCLFLLKSLSDRSLFFLSITLFIIGVSIQYIGNYHVFAGTYIDLIANKTHIYRNFLFVGLPFVTIGYLISKKQLETYINEKAIWAVFIGSIALLTIEGAINTFYINDYSQTFDILISQFFVGPSLLILILKSKKKTKFSIYAKMSTGIYFIHPLFLLVLPHVLDSRTAIFFSTLLLSVGSAYLLARLNRRFQIFL
jgi:hypothetical protein